MKNLERRLTIAIITTAAGLVAWSLFVKIANAQPGEFEETVRRILPESLLPKPRPRPSKNACIANLKQLDGAKATWALENKKSSTDTPTHAELFGPTNYIREKPICPQGGIYTFGDVSTKTSCSLAPRGHTL